MNLDIDKIFDEIFDEINRTAHIINFIKKNKDNKNEDLYFNGLKIRITGGDGRRYILFINDEKFWIYAIEHAGLPLNNLDKDFYLAKVHPRVYILNTMTYKQFLLRLKRFSSSIHNQSTIGVLKKSGKVKKYKLYRKDNNYIINNTVEYDDKTLYNKLIRKYLI